jgi:hypothetical protein
MPRKAFDTWQCRYKIEKQGRQHTPQFKQISYIYTPAGDEIGYVAHDPHEDLLPPDMGLLKLNNKYLYQTNMKEFVIDLLKELGMTFRGISRIDVALDFQRFNNNLNPHKFIENFYAGKYMKKGKTKVSNVADCGGVKGLRYETLKFGSGHSDVQYYMYNKSKEMKDVKHKQWIEDNWKANGYDGNGDVWRLEFRLKRNRKGIYRMNPETGELDLFFDMTTLDSLDNIHELYSYLFNKYFSFVRNEKRTRLDRCKPLVLFSNGFETKGVAIKLSEKKEADRAARIHAKHLVKLEYELKGLDFGLAVLANEMVGYYIQSRGLSEWAENRLHYQVSEKQKILYNSRQICSALSGANYDRLLTKVSKSHNPLLTVKSMRT